jgi:hypothetical protein
MKQIILSGFALFGFIQLQGQRLELVSNAGEYYFNSNLSLSWSLGEPVTETFNTNGVILTQGFQQISDGTVLAPEQKSIKPFDLQIKPNPVNDKVFIKVIKSQNNQAQLYQVEIFSILGEIIHKDFYNENIIEIDLSKLKPGAYMIKVTTPKSGQHSTKLIQKV